MLTKRTNGKTGSNKYNDDMENNDDDMKLDSDENNENIRKDSIDSIFEVILF
jgi:hypothetical protein